MVDTKNINHYVNKYDIIFYTNNNNSHVLELRFSYILRDI